MATIGKKMVELEDEHRKTMFSNPETPSKICTELLKLREENPNWKELTREIREGN